MLLPSQAQVIIRQASDEDLFCASQFMLSNRNISETLYKKFRFRADPLGMFSIPARATPRPPRFRDKF
jgi:hypothetical protein